MPRNIDNMDTLQKYTKGILEKTEHHAQNVSEIIFPLIGLIVAFKDNDEDLKVMTQDEEMKNVLWARIRGNRYAFSYNHESQSIEMREGSTQGRTINSFKNGNPLGSIIDFFRKL